MKQIIYIEISFVCLSENGDEIHSCYRFVSKMCLEDFQKAYVIVKEKMKPIYPFEIESIDCFSVDFIALQKNKK